MSTKRDINLKSLANNRYSDFFTNLTIHPNKRDLVVQKEQDAVKRSIRNIVMTDPTERPYNPKFGCNIKKYLFEQLDDVTASNIKKEIKYSIETFEPRANLIDIILSYETDRQIIHVSVLFSIINKTDVVQLDLQIDRVR